MLFQRDMRACCRDAGATCCLEKGDFVCRLVIGALACGRGLL